MFNFFADLFGFNDTKCRICGKDLADGNYGCAFVGRGFCLRCVQELWKELGK